MKFIYNLPGRWVPLNTAVVSGSAYRTFVQTAEEVGFYGACLDEHPAPVSPWLNAGGGHHCLDPFVALAMFAGATTKLRLLTYLAILPFRNPFMFSKVATSLDVVSDGRLILGCGTGYMEGEFAAMGVDFDKRNELFEEAIDIFRRACTGEPVTEIGLGFDAREVVIQPRPVQLPHPPLWLGGNARLTLRRVAEWGQGWLPMPRKRGVRGTFHKTPPLETLADMGIFLDYMFEHADKLGRREPIEVVSSLALANGSMTGKVMPFDEQVDAIREFQKIGVTGFTLNTEGRTIEEEIDKLTAFGEEVIAKLA